MSILVTGGAGFIGSNFVINWLQQHDETIINLDLLTYAGNLDNLSSIKNNERHIFVKGDIRDSKLIEYLLITYKPRAIINFAAESHVDNSILNPEEFISTNVVGTFRLLECSKKYLNDFSDFKDDFRFIHVSTDEVFGSLKLDEPAFTETNPYKPNSPYSASKAGSDHLVRSYHKTYNLPTIITNCSNNYGPRQFPEKLIPLVIKKALLGETLPIYGDGQQIRDWLYVDDHCNALIQVLEKGIVGETYNIGGSCEKTNLEVVSIICETLDSLVPKGNSYKQQITFVTDRPGHDRRYAIDANKIQSHLNWQPQINFEEGIRNTLSWYLKIFMQETEALIV